MAAEESNDRKSEIQKIKRKKRLLRESQNAKNRGVCYFSRIPPRMDPTRFRQILSHYGDIDRIYLTPENPAAQLHRKRAGGFRGLNFSEGWVEFISKSVAKRVAHALNGEQIGISTPEVFLICTPAKEHPRFSRKRKCIFDETVVLSNEVMKQSLNDSSGLIMKRRVAPLSALAAWKHTKYRDLCQDFSEPIIPCGKKKSQFYYDLWNIKYLSKFKWDDLTEEIAYKMASREQKLALESSAATKERDSYLSKVDKSRALAAIQERMDKKQKISEEPDVQTEPKVIRYFPQTRPILDTSSQSEKPRLSKEVLAGVFGGSS